MSGPIASFPATDLSRRLALRLAGLGGLSVLSACVSLETAGSDQPKAPPAPQRQEIGSGAITVALLLPLSSSGGGAAAAQSLRNACELAMGEFVKGEFRLVVKDDLGTPAGASAAATAAIAEGAKLILGPLFGPSVAASGAVARSAGIPMVAFSSDASVAAPGVYLLSFMPQSDVERIVAYAAGIGKQSIAALIPKTAYGSVVQAEFQQATAQHGIRIPALEQYPVDRMGMQAPVAHLAPVVQRGEADALFIPEGGDALPLVAQSLTVSGVDPRRIQLLGTGVWEDPRVFADPLLQGGLYAAPEAAGFRAFSDRYLARYGSAPVRLASLGYDAISLVTALIKAYGGGAFDAANIANPSGFSGVDGAFRFRPDGTSQRSLAVLKVTPQGGETVSPASRSFSA